LKDKETAEEKIFFNKQEEMQLRELLKKMKTQAETSDKVTARVTGEKERKALLEIVGKYGVKPDDVAALLEWRHRTDL